MKNDNKTNKNFAHMWSLVAQSSSIDSNNNNLSLFNILEEIQIEVLSAATGQINPEIFNIPMSFSLVSVWKKTVKDISVTAEIQVKIVDPKEKELQKIGYQLIIPADRLSMRGIVNGSIIPVTESGEHFFKIYIKEAGEAEFREAGKVPFIVTIKKKVA